MCSDIRDQFGSLNRVCLPFAAAIRDSCKNVTFSKQNQNDRGCFQEQRNCRAVWGRKNRVWKDSAEAAVMKYYHQNKSRGCPFFFATSPQHTPSITASGGASERERADFPVAQA